MRDRKWSVLGLGVATALLAAMALGCAVRAEDYCDTQAIMEKVQSRDAIEKKVREKCKPGDIIFVDTGLLLPRLCDLHQRVTRCGSTCPGGDQANYCFLAPPHKIY
ncbi:MAG: hypothetical protein ACLPPF_07990 [Rhodomicrobium sp.]